MASAGATNVDNDSASSMSPACGTSTMTGTSGARGSVRTKGTCLHNTRDSAPFKAGFESTYSGAGVRLSVGLAYAVLGDVCVNLGRGHVGVAEQCLYAAQIGTARQQMRRERMAKLMRVDVSANAGTARSAADDFPEGLAGELAAARRREEQLRNLSALAARALCLG